MSSGTAALTIGPSSSFDGNVTISFPQIYLNGCTYNGFTTIEKNGATDNTGTGGNTFGPFVLIVNSGTGNFRTNGGNTFNGQATFLNNSTSDILFEFVTGSVYNGNVSLQNFNSSRIRVAYAGASTFNGNIDVNNFGGGEGIFFGESATATATLTSGQITVGSFPSGSLTLSRFIQTGFTSQNLAMSSGTAALTIGPSSAFNGNVNFAAPQVFLNGCVYNGTAIIEKNGNTTDDSVGGNTFAAGATLTNSGTGTFRLANAMGDNFLADATFNQFDGLLQPAYNNTDIYRGNVTVGGSTPVIFGANNGTVAFAGGAPQSISKSGTASPVFGRLVIIKTSDEVTLNTDASVAVNATMSSGILNTSTINFINFADDATATGGSNTSHIDGPVRKTGDDSFTFPTGDNGFYRSISISAPTNPAHFFTAEYFKASQPFGGAATYPVGISTVSSCEYWIVDRDPLIGGSNVNVTISWNSPDCPGPYIANLPNLRVMRWNGTSWVNEGNTATTGNAISGTITSALISSFNPITLGSTTPDNPLPIELMSFTAEPVDDNVKLNWTTASELNNDFFTLQRSENGIEFMGIATVKGAGTVQTKTDYEYIDRHPGTGLWYFRLKQTDLDGNSTLSKVVAIELLPSNDFSLFPNPVGFGSTVFTNTPSDFAILNNLGVTVLKIMDTDKLDISSLAQGVYLVRNARGKTQRLVIY